MAQERLLQRALETKFTDSCRVSITQAVNDAYRAAYGFAKEFQPELLASALGYNRWLKVESHLEQAFAPGLRTEFVKVSGTGIHYTALEVSDTFRLTAKHSHGGIRLVGDAGYRAASARTYQPRLFNPPVIEAPETLDRFYGVILHGNFEDVGPSDQPCFISVAFPDYNFREYVYVEHLVGSVALESLEPEVKPELKAEIQEWLTRPKRRSNE